MKLTIAFLVFITLVFFYLGACFVMNIADPFKFLR